MSFRKVAFIAAFTAVATQSAAQSDATIDPGMTREEVVGRLGKPVTESKTGNAWFMFYRNGCERSCGMNDLVILEDGKVVDAVFRSPSRHYSAASSSPTGVRPERSTGDVGSSGAVDRVRKAGRGGLVISNPAAAQQAPAGRATVTGVEVNGTPAQSGAAANAAGAGAATPSGTTAAGGGSGGGASFGGTAGGNAPQVTTPGGNSPQTGSPDAATAPGTGAQRPIIPVPLPGAKINPADSVRALTPDRPTAMPGAKINPADSVRAEAIRKQQSDTTRKPD